MNGYSHTERNYQNLRTLGGGQVPSILLKYSRSCNELLYAFFIHDDDSIYCIRIVCTPFHGLRPLLKYQFQTKAVLDLLIKQVVIRTCSLYNLDRFKRSWESLSLMLAKY